MSIYVYASNMLHVLSYTNCPLYFNKHTFKYDNISSDYGVNTTFKNILHITLSSFGGNMTHDQKVNEMMVF